MEEAFDLYNKEDVCFENENYAIVIGSPPISHEFPEPFDTYLVVNKKFGVVEYMNSMFPYAKHTAEDLDRVTREGFGAKKENEERSAFPDKFL